MLKNPFTRTQEPTKFRVWEDLNDNQELQTLVGITGPGRRHKIDEKLLPLLKWPEDSKQLKFSMILAKKKAVPRKEFFETCEFWHEVETRRNKKKGALMCDDDCKEKLLVEVAGGHGLFSALVALHTKKFDKIIIADLRKPKSFQKVIDSLREISPEAAEKIIFKEEDFKSNEILTSGCAVACVHGCGSLTDIILSESIKKKVKSIAVMPCCYANCIGAKKCPNAIRLSLGDSIAADMIRTQELESSNYNVRWSSISEVITPMNRIIIGSLEKFHYSN